MDGGGILKPTEDGREGIFGCASALIMGGAVVAVLVGLNGGSAGGVVGGVNELEPPGGTSGLGGGRDRG